MPFDDYRVHAELRLLLIRSWVDLSSLDYGVTSGVAYIRGTLRPHRLAPNGNGNGTEAALAEAVLAGDLETSINRLSGVRDVVFQLENLIKIDSDWRPRP